MAYISGDGITVDFDVVTSETDGASATVTTSPIEGNQQISDHVSKNPDTISINATIVKDSNNKLFNLKKMMNQATLCRYVSRTIATNCVITRLSAPYSSGNKTGYDLTLTLAVVRVSTTQEFTYTTSASAGQTNAQINKQTNVGVTLPASKTIDTVTASTVTAGAAGILKIFNPGTGLGAGGR